MIKIINDSEVSGSSVLKNELENSARIIYLNFWESSLSSPIIMYLFVKGVLDVTNSNSYKID